MLAKENRLVSKKDFALATKFGVRYRSKFFVIYFYRYEKPDFVNPVKVGFIISKKVGNSVVRHRIARVLRHIFREDLPSFSGIDLIVLRALPEISQTDRNLLRSQILNFKNKYLLRIND